jgi:hypothetical protein
MKTLTKFAMPFAFALLAFSMNGSAVADIVYCEDGESLTAGTDTLADSTDWNGSAGDYDVLAGGSVFSTNHFDLQAPDGNFNFANWEPAGPHSAVQTFCIDLADTGGGGTNADAGVRIAARQTGGSTFFDVVSQNLTDNQVYTFHVVANNSGSAVTYDDGVTTIAAGTADLWQDGVLVQSKALNSGASGDIFSWGLWSRRPDNAMLGDNIKVHDTAFNGATAIPEPSALALLGLGVVGLVGRRRRS